MKKYVALLRGINVGGNSKVEMKKLKEVFESLGFSNVSTYINSGNVIFETSKATSPQIIEIALKKQFGFEIKTIVRDSKNIEKICKEVPKSWQNNKEQKTDVIFLWDEFDNKKSLNLIKSTEVDNIIYIKGCLIWNIDRKNYGKSAMNKFIGTLLYKNMTARNINTVRKLDNIVNNT